MDSFLRLAAGFCIVVAMGLPLAFAGSETLLKQAVSAIDSAHSLEEFQTSSLYPSKVLSRLSPAEACHGLKKLSAEDLTAFENDLEGNQNLPCVTELKQRLQRHWQAAKISFELQGGPEGRGTLEGRDHRLLASHEKTIDTMNPSELTRAELGAGEIALTFDDGPHPTRTRRVLDVLATYGVRATFFETGHMAHRWRGLSREVIEGGHSLGSHSFTHAFLPRLSMAAARQEILSGHAAVAEQAGTIFPFFRFPYGARSPRLNSLLQSQGLTSFLWNIDSDDWRLRNPAALYQNVIRAIQSAGGGILLFHDTHEQTVIVLPRVLQFLERAGFTTHVFVPATTVRP